MSEPSAGARLILVSAPSGAGKTSLVRALLERDPGVALSVSHTTRAPRPNEVDGVHYHFVDTARFESMCAADAFLEHARVFDHHYGTSREAVEVHRGAGLDVILEIDWQGARQVRERVTDAYGVFILPPSLEALAGRLRARGQDSEAVVARRLRDAREDMGHHTEFDYVVVNETFERTLDDLAAIVRAERCRGDRQVRRHPGLASRQAVDR